jgi:hypothetical protein
MTGLRQPCYQRQSDYDMAVSVQDAGPALCAMHACCCCRDVEYPLPHTGNSSAAITSALTMLVVTCI